MKPLALTKEKAIDLNAICLFALEDKEVVPPFGIAYYQRRNPQYSIEYLRHIIQVAKQYDDVNNWIDFSHNAIQRTANTRHFLLGGGFETIRAQEEAEETTKALAHMQLRQNVFGSRPFWIMFFLTNTITFIITFMAARYGPTKEEKSQAPKPTPDSTRHAAKIFFYRQDLPISFGKYLYMPPIPKGQLKPA